MIVEGFGGGGRGFSVCIRQGNTGSGGRQDFRNTLADAFGAACDEGHLAVETEEFSD